MRRNCVRFVCFLLASFFAIDANASGAPKRHARANSSPMDFLSGASPQLTPASWQLASYLPPTLYAPASPDNWRGGSGHWSNAADWTAGTPGIASDVTINTGNDNVTLDTSASINSLTLGGSSGSSTLIDPTGNGYTLSIAGPLTVNHSGTLSLSAGDVATVSASSTNLGVIQLNSGAQLQINGSFSNPGELMLDTGSGINVSGNLAVAGTIEYLGDPQVGITVGGSLNNIGVIDGGNINVVGNMSNTFLISPVQLNVNGTLTNSGPAADIEIVKASATVGSLINSGTINVITGGIVVRGDMSNAGLITVNVENPQSQSEITVGGTFTNGSAGYISVGNSGAFGLGEILTANNLVNHGTLLLPGTGSLQVYGNATNSGTLVTADPGSNQISIEGRLTNGAGAVFQLLGTGDTAYIRSLTNMGSILVGTNATLTVPVGNSAAGNALAGFLNAGTVLIDLGGTISSYGKYTQTTGQTTVDGRLEGIINFAGGSVYGNGGTIAGSTTSNASINFGEEPMSVGQLTFAGNYVQGANGSVTFDIASANQYDKMDITGQARLNGTMNIDLLQGYVPHVGNTFEVMTFAGESGTFSNVVGLPINGQEHFTLEYNSNNLTLDVVSGALAGLSASKNSGSSGEPFVQIAEVDPAQMAREGGALQSTPEPGSMVMFGSGVAGLIGWLRRKSARS